MFDEHRNVVIR